MDVWFNNAMTCKHVILKSDKASTASLCGIFYVVSVHNYMPDSSTLYLMCFRNTTPCKHFHELQYERSTKEYSNY